MVMFAVPSAAMLLADETKLRRASRFCRSCSAPSLPGYICSFSDVALHSKTLDTQRLCTGTGRFSEVEALPLATAEHHVFTIEIIVLKNISSVVRFAFDKTLFASGKSYVLPPLLLHDAPMLLLICAHVNKLYILRFAVAILLNTAAAFIFALLASMSLQNSTRGLDFRNGCTPSKDMLPYSSPFACAMA